MTLKSGGTTDPLKTPTAETQPCAYSPMPSIRSGLPSILMLVAMQQPSEISIRLSYSRKHTKKKKIQKNLMIITNN